jgi:PAS domain S-box-containing protein
MNHAIFDVTTWPPQVQALLNAAPDGLLVVAPDGTMLLANAQVERLFGYSREELLGASVERLVPLRFPDERKRSMDLAGRRKDGSEFPAELCLSPLETDGTTFTIVAIRDVTARKRAEALFRGLLEAAPDAMVIQNPAGTIALVNVQTEKIFGYRREELLGHPVEVLVPDRFRAAHRLHREAYTRAPRTRPIGAGLDLHGLRKDGSEFPAEISLSPLETPDGVFITAAIRDISDRKRAEEAQRSLVAEASTLLSSALDTVAVCDAMARLAVLHIADTCEIALIGPGGDIERIAIARRGSGEPGVPPAPTTSQAIQDALTRALERRSPEHADDRARAIEGQAPNDTLVVPLVARGEAIGGMVLVSDLRPYGPGDLALAEDLAHRTAIAVDNARLYRDAKEANAAKDRFLAVLGHELRNPLSAAFQALQVIERVRTWDARVERHVAIIDRQVRHLSGLVDSLLDVSRISAGKVVLRREMVDLREVAHRCVETHSVETGGRKQELMISAPSSPIWVEGDVARLEQILDNLLTNAIKNTPTEGNILIEVRRQGQEAILRVRDDGFGIEPRMLPRIFDLFTQGDQSLEHTHGGLGLGLPVVRQLVELHGGTITAQSAGANQGSEFVVRLPLFWDRVPVAAPRPAANVGTAQGAQQHRHLLIVEDNPDARQSLQDLLEMSGYQVDVAEDGQRGIEVALSQRPDAVFVDIGLPLVDGYEVARRLRSHFGQRGIRLIALTGYGQPEDRIRALAAGFDVHLVKPVDLETMNQALAPLSAPAASA